MHAETAENCAAPAHDPPTRLWVLRRHSRVTLRQAHAVVAVDRARRVALTSCGLPLSAGEIRDVPSTGCMPCELCVAATPLAKADR